MRLGDTLRTTTEVVARRENRAPAPTGLAVLRIRTVDQEDRPVLDFTRCAMLPLRGEPTGEDGDEVGGAEDLEHDALLAAAPGLDLAALPAGRAALRRAPEGWTDELEGGDVVDSAPALARLTLNVAMAHLDRRARHGRRLVYGGHTIALAAAQATRALPGLVTILGWHAADHPRRCSRATRCARASSSSAASRCPAAAAAAPALARERGARRRRRRARLALRGGAGVSEQPLADLRVIEGSAFVAAPLGGMTLAQLGADVIRFDQIGGGLDHNRWPLAPIGQSAVLGRAEQGQALDPGRPALRRGPRAGRGADRAGDGRIFLTNFPARGWLAYDALRERREDLIMCALTGNPDGSTEVDYTVNPATGFPWATGPRDLAEPLNSVLPAWDVAMGELAAIGILAAERHRTRTGEGSWSGSRSPTSRSRWWATSGGSPRRSSAARDRRARRQLPLRRLRARLRDQRRAARDGRRAHRAPVDRAAGGHRHAEAFRALESVTGHDLASEDGRFGARDLIAAVLRPWFEARTLDEIRAAFEGTGVSWGPYQTFRQLVSEDPRASDGEPDVLDDRAAGDRRLPRAGLAARADRRAALPPRPRAALGEHTEEILAGVLGLGAAEIGRLFDAGVVAGGLAQGVQAALGLAGAGPAALAPRARDGAVRAADRRVALVVELVVGQVVLGDVAPHVVVRPVRERVELPALVLGVPGELGRAGRATATGRRRRPATQASTSASARLSGWTLRRSQQASGSRSHSRSPCSAAWRPRLGPWKTSTSIP